jgi:hypothetical protein
MKLSQLLMLALLPLKYVLTAYTVADAAVCKLSAGYSLDTANGFGTISNATLTPCHTYYRCGNDVTCNDRIGLVLCRCRGCKSLNFLITAELLLSAGCCSEYVGQYLSLVADAFAIIMLVSLDPA